MKKIASLFLITSFILFAGCQCGKSIVADNPYGLPNATQIGANTFACLINGQKYIAKYNPSNGTGAFVRQDTLSVSGEPNYNDYLEHIGIVIKGYLKQDTSYNIDSLHNYAVLGTDSTCLGISFNITVSYAVNGLIQLTKFDTTKKIVSGTFILNFPMPNCDTLHVTEGRFDYQYY